MKCENIECNKKHDGAFGSGRFCSRSCANSRKHSDATKIKISKTLGGNGILKEKGKNCLNCGRKLNGTLMYCSSKCRNDYEYKQYIKRWKQGLENGTKGNDGTSGYIKRYIKEKYNNQCSKCGWNEINEKTGKTPVELEHIDGHWNNNKEENLDLLCPNCHSLTPTYKSLNKGNGRKNRK